MWRKAFVSKILFFNGLSIFSLFLIIACAPHIRTNQKSTQKSLNDATQLNTIAKSRTKPHNETSAFEPKNLENIMSIKKSWILPEISISPERQNWTIIENGDIWAANYDGPLTRLSRESDEIKSVKLGEDDSSIKIHSIANGGNEKLFLLLEDIRKRKVLSWGLDSTRPSRIELNKTPMELVWSKSTGDIWYIASDSSLNIRSANTEHTITGQYSGIVVSEDGNQIGVGQKVDEADTETQFIIFSALRIQQMWSMKIRMEGIDVVGFGPYESIIFNQIGYTMDDESNRVINTATKIQYRTGEMESIFEDGTVAVASRGRTIIFLKNLNDGRYYVGLGDLKIPRRKTGY